MSSEMTISQTAELSTEERSERARKAFILIEQVRVAGYTTAMALKQLRDDKVHELLSYEDFEEFCDNELPFLKPKQISKYLQIADTFGDRLSVKEMLAKRGGMTALLEVAEEIKVKGIEPSSLSDEDIEDIILR
ncbi:MAG TPA: hypothetical protein PK683_22285, partial [Leptospiraceae bacterium]|nr:hypothetical protein [Leptospiraceae bacterium]